MKSASLTWASCQSVGDWPPYVPSPDGRPGDESESSEQWRPVHLTRWGRTWCTVFGLVATGAGGVAPIFTEDLEAGPVALLAFGFVFLLLAIVGYVPRSAKMGGAELASSRTRLAGSWPRPSMLHRP